MNRRTAAWARLRRWANGGTGSSRRARRSSVCPATLDTDDRQRWVDVHPTGNPRIAIHPEPPAGPAVRVPFRPGCPGPDAGRAAGRGSRPSSGSVDPPTGSTPAGLPGQLPRLPGCPASSPRLPGGGHTGPRWSTTSLRIRPKGTERVVLTSGAADGPLDQRLVRLTDRPTRNSSWAATARNACARQAGVASSVRGPRCPAQRGAPRSRAPVAHGPSSRPGARRRATGGSGRLSPRWGLTMPLRHGVDWVPVGAADRRADGERPAGPAATRSLEEPMSSTRDRRSDHGRAAQASGSVRPGVVVHVVHNVLTSASRSCWSPPWSADRAFEETS